VPGLNRVQCAVPPSGATSDPCTRDQCVNVFLGQTPLATWRLTWERALVDRQSGGGSLSSDGAVLSDSQGAFANAVVPPQAGDLVVIKTLPAQSTSVLDCSAFAAPSGAHSNLTFTVQDVEVDASG